jgi:outer membrane protein OmpA-like peptidoglycan-associated protein
MKQFFVFLLMKCPVACLFILIPFFCFSQNLILNGGFEEENICIEYKVNCAPEAWLINDDVFNNYFKDPDIAYQGSHCMSIEAGRDRKPYKRTFIRTQLLCGLRNGNRYRVEFFIKSPHRILDSIGIYFSSTDLLFDKRRLQTIEPSLYLADSHKQFKNDSSWQQVVLDYTAKGDESFFAIANFSKRDITGETGIALENRFFAYVDNVSIVPLNPNEKLCDDWQTTMAGIYDQDERHEFLSRNIKNRRAFQPMPVVLEPNKIIRIDTLILQEVLFAVGKADLEKDSYILLDSFCRQVVGKKVDSVVVEGHTDNAGTNELNNRLSSARVQTVLNYFAGRAFVKPNRIIARAWGETKPVADNSTPQGRQRNRRVEVLVYIRE